MVVITHLKPQWANVIQFPDGRQVVVRARYNTRKEAIRHASYTTLKVVYRLRIRYKNFVPK